jgi:hypothetical protein
LLAAETKSDVWNMAVAGMVRGFFGGEMSSFALALLIVESTYAHEIEAFVVRR